MRYRIGNTSKVSRVAVISPPITTVASGRCTSAPAPVLIAIGKKPSEATEAVINTGLGRVSFSWSILCNYIVYAIKFQLIKLC